MYVPCLSLPICDKLDKMAMCRKASRVPTSVCAGPSGAQATETLPRGRAVHASCTAPAPSVSERGWWSCLQIRGSQMWRATLRGGPSGWGAFNPVTVLLTRRRDSPVGARGWGAGQGPPPASRFGASRR